MYIYTYMHTFASLGLGLCLFDCVEYGEVDKSQLIVSVAEEVPYIKCDVLFEVLSVMVL